MNFWTKSKVTEPFAGTGVLLITGGPNSGRTTQLIGQLNACEGSKLLLRASDPLSKWVQDAGFQAWCVTRPQEGEKKPKVADLIDLLPTYVATGIHLFVDDVDKLTGARKQDLVKTCIVGASSVSCTCVEEGRIPPSIRLLLEGRAELQEIQYIKLRSNAPYDITTIGVGLVIVIAAALGFHEASIVLSGVLILARGPRATRT